MNYHVELPVQWHCVMRAKENRAILVINSGSSSIKFALFLILDNADLKNIHHGEIKNITEKRYESAIKNLFNRLDKILENFILIAVGHRIVHGGKDFFSPIRITPEVIKKITKYIPLAPLHQPHNIEIIKIISRLYPKLIQIACFDTGFHHTQNILSKSFAIPEKLSDQGIIRYGFHGLSYEYIADNLQSNQKIIAAHLGSGASMCAIIEGKSVATSMGFTALDGLMMGTRCGNIDPGVILYLLENKKYNVNQITKLLYQQSGLLGVSGISGDMQKLESSASPKAKFAIELFCYRAALEFGALYTVLGGCDEMVFTAGIGEHSSLVRKKICGHLRCFGLMLNEKSNLNHSAIISHKESKILVRVIPANEELMIAKHTYNLS